MATRKQINPLDPSVYRFPSDEDEAIYREFKQLRRKRYLQCCGCFTALLLIAAVMIIVLAIVFHTKNPRIKMNSITIQHMELFSNGSIRTDRNITLLADVSVKNPNMASFRYRNTTTTIYYGGTVVGETKTPTELAKARRTLRLNMTVDIMPAKILSAPGLSNDFLSDALNMRSNTRIAEGGKLLKIFKRSVVVKMNCTFTFNIKSQAIQDNCCRQQGIS